MVQTEHINLSIASSISITNIIYYLFNDIKRVIATNYNVKYFGIY